MLPLKEIDSSQKHNKNDGRPVYKMYAFRFVEAGLRRTFWYFGRSIPTKKALFVFLPIAFVLLSLIGPVMHRERMKLLPPFDTFVFCNSAHYPASGHSNLRAITRTDPIFNGSNPAYSVIRRDSPSEFSIIMHSKNYDSIILDEPINLFAKLDQSVKTIVVNYERTNLTWSELCREECTENDNILQQIIESDSQKTLTYPETFITNKKTGNSTRLFLGLVVGVCFF
ncbi:unnamed protein product [Thelazia callipaeda]|uniref:ABCA8 n=1 Tax=Thelazia callipaeda TaxID=103827 RepID=A0A0N5DCB4_THECL|nr:unnamed protein product [Thelazia callipaeda]